MVKFSEYIVEGDSKSQKIVLDDIENEIKLYNVAMKALNSKDLEKAMMVMKNKFSDKIDWSSINWSKIYQNLNEQFVGVSDLLEGFKEKDYDKLMDGLDSDKFTQAMYDWFQDNYPDAPLYAGDATPDEFIDLLDGENNPKMIKKFYTDMKKYL
jgi:hypothetical protein